MNFHSCPVCGYSVMPYPPVDYNICPCCGTEFGLDDADTTHLELRNEWLSRGALWFSDEQRPAPNWNPFVQLALANLEYDPKYNLDFAENQIDSQSKYSLVA